MKDKVLKNPKIYKAMDEPKTITNKIIESTIKDIALE